VVVDGTVEGPIQGVSVILKSGAHVVGDIHHQSLAIESGAFFDGRSIQIRGNGQTPEKLEKKSLRQSVNTRDTLSRRAVWKRISQTRNSRASPARATYGTAGPAYISER
jgi:Polymer-forming cytoskeletal